MQRSGMNQVHVNFFGDCFLGAFIHCFQMGFVVVDFFFCFVLFFIILFYYFFMALEHCSDTNHCLLFVFLLDKTPTYSVKSHVGWLASFIQKLSCRLALVFGVIVDVKYLQ